MQKGCMCSGFPDDATGQGGESLIVLSFQITGAGSILFVSPLANILWSRVVAKETKSFDSSFSDRCQKSTSIYFAWTYIHVYKYFKKKFYSRSATHRTSSPFTTPRRRLDLRSGWSRRFYLHGRGSERKRLGSGDVRQVEFLFICVFFFAIISSPYTCCGGLRCCAGIQGGRLSRSEGGRIRSSGRGGGCGLKMGVSAEWSAQACSTSAPALQNKKPATPITTVLWKPNQIK